MNKIFGKTANGTKVLVEYSYNDAHAKIGATVKLASNGEVLDEMILISNGEDVENDIATYLAKQEY